MRISDWSSDVCSSISGVLVSKTSSTVFPNQFRPVAKIVLPLLVIFVYWPAPTPVAANSSAIGSARPETNTPWLLSNRYRWSLETARPSRDRKRVVAGKSVSVRVDLGGRSINKKQNKNKTKQQHN